MGCRLLLYLDGGALNFGLTPSYILFPHLFILTSIWPRSLTMLIVIQILSLIKPILTVLCIIPHIIFITKTTLESIIYPTANLSQRSIDTRNFSTTSNTPGNNTNLYISVFLMFHWANKRTSPITLASISSLLSSTNHTGI